MLAAQRAAHEAGTTRRAVQDAEATCARFSDALGYDLFGTGGRATTRVREQGGDAGRRAGRSSQELLEPAPALHHEPEGGAARGHGTRVLRADCPAAPVPTAERSGCDTRSRMPAGRARARAQLRHARRALGQRHGRRGPSLLSERSRHVRHRLRDRPHRDGAPESTAHSSRAASTMAIRASWWGRISRATCCRGASRARWQWPSSARMPIPARFAIARDELRAAINLPAQLPDLKPAVGAASQIVVMWSVRRARESWLCRDHHESIPFEVAGAAIHGRDGPGQPRFRTHRADVHVVLALRPTSAPAVQFARFTLIASQSRRVRLLVLTPGGARGAGPRGACDAEAVMLVFGDSGPSAAMDGRAGAPMDGFTAIPNRQTRA